MLTTVIYSALSIRSFLPTEQKSRSSTEFFFWGHDPLTHVRRARYLAVYVGDPSLSVSFSLSLILPRVWLILMCRCFSSAILSRRLICQELFIGFSGSARAAEEAIKDTRENDLMIPDTRLGNCRSQQYCPKPFWCCWPMRESEIFFNQDVLPIFFGALHLSA